MVGRYAPTAAWSDFRVGSRPWADVSDDRFAGSAWSEARFGSWKRRHESVGNTDPDGRDWLSMSGEDVESRRRVGHEEIFFAGLPLLMLWTALAKPGVKTWTLFVAISCVGVYQLIRLRTESVSWTPEAIELRTWPRAPARWPMDGSCALIARDVYSPDRWLFPMRRPSLFLVDSMTLRRASTFIRLYPNMHTNVPEWMSLLEHARLNGRLAADEKAVELLRRVASGSR